MVTPKQIAVLLGLCATSLGLLWASQLAEDEPIVLWGEQAPVAVVSPQTLAAATAKAPAPPKNPVKPSAAVAKATPKPVAVAKATPKPVAVAQATPKPSAVPPPKTAASVKPAAASAAPVAVKAEPVPSAKPVQVATQPKAQPARPQPEAAGSDGGGGPVVGGKRIAASSPEKVAALAKQMAGRVDPFVSLDLPSADNLPTIGKPGVKGPPAVPGAPAPLSTRPKPTPVPAPGDGMVVTGIITSPRESVAIVAADGRSRLVQVGDLLPGGVRVVAIQSQGKTVIVSHGGRSARLAVKE